jgi:pimeloyl-ACP methyl ester carboxylesterase
MKTQDLREPGISRKAPKGRKQLACLPTHELQEDVRMICRMMILLFVVLGSSGPLLPFHRTAAAESATPAPPAGELHWETCTDVQDAECAWLEVPLDPARPDGPQIALRLARLPALDPNRSQGALLIIPGGPGVGITAAGGQFGVLRPIFHLDELRETYDVVTYDPRGIGQSSPIRCAPVPVPTVSTDALNGVMSAAEFETLARANKTFAESCFAATGELMAHLSARDSAADIEQIRLALGQDDGLVAYAGSYGTLYATAYLEQYGDHVKALVIDGVVDHSIDLAPYGVRWISSTEDAFSRFGQWCAEEPPCALHGQDVAAGFDAVVAEHPELRAFVRARLSAGRATGLGWPIIADTLATLAQGDPPAASPEPAASPVPSDPALVSGELGLFRGVLCADYGPQDDYAALAADNEALARQAPHFAWLYSLELPGSCAGWPRAATNPPHRLHLPAGSHPNVLVANPTHDPATPLVAAVAVWSQIPQARLLIADTDGHQALPFSRCAFETQVQFLSDPSSLATTTFCPAETPLAIPALSTVTDGPNDCAFLIKGSDDPRERLGDIACGSLDVPENWNDPEGRRLQIGYLILKSTAAQPMSDPVVFLAGGPGSSPLTGGEIWARFFAGLRQERDVIFFDQRGTRLSSPLRCEAYTKIMALALPPEVDDGAGVPPPPVHPAELSDPDALMQQARERYGPSADACLQQLEESGVDLSQYNSIASANDAVALVKALGYDKYNLYGVSYGTRLALEVMRNHSDSGLRSVVLDSTYPPEIKTYEQLATSSHEVVIQLFADCARNQVCNAAYPDLKARFIALLARLHNQPVISADGVTINDRELISVMQSLTSRIEIAPFVPLLIAELERGEDETYRGIASGSLFATAGATPEADGAGATLATAAPPIELSAARRFVQGLQARAEPLPEHEAGGLPRVLTELDTHAHDRQTLREFIGHAFAQPEQAEASAALLSAIDAMSEADVQEVFTVIEQTITLADSQIAGQTVPQYYSIECSERAPFQSFVNAVRNARQLEIPDLALGMPEALVKVFAICERWPSGQAPATEEQPVRSDVPTLILSGAYDNLTPVSWNKSAFTTLPNGFFVLAPMSGHAVITYSACAERVAQAFIADPATSPDTSCLADLEPRWVLPPAVDGERQRGL